MPNTTDTTAPLFLTGKAYADHLAAVQAERKARLDARWAAWEADRLARGCEPYPQATDATPEGLATTCDSCGSAEAHSTCDEPAPTAAERRAHARLHDSDGAFIGCAYCMERVAGHGPDLDMCRPCYRQARRDGTVDVEERR